MQRKRQSLGFGIAIALTMLLTYFFIKKSKELVTYIAQLLAMLVGGAIAQQFIIQRCSSWGNVVNV